MKIQSTAVQQQIIPQAKIEKKEETSLPKEQVELGKNDVTPDYLKKPQIDTAGCAMLGGTAGAMISGGLGATGGIIWAGIGWAANAIGGPTGTAVATVGAGAWGVFRAFEKDEDLVASFKSYVGIKEPSTEKRIARGIIKGSTNAAAAFLGATFGPAGLAYGAIVKGGVQGAITGTKWAMWGAGAGAVAETVQGATQIVETAAKIIEKEAGK